MIRPGEAATLKAGTFRFKRLRVVTALLGALALLAFAGSSAYDAWRSYRHSLVATDREVNNLARALAEQTAWTWQAVDLLLDDTARWYRSESHDTPPEKLDEALAARTAAIRQVRMVTIVDAQGIQRHRSRDLPPFNTDVSDRSYYIAQRDGSAPKFYMSEPLVTRSENRAAVVISRRLEPDNGAFAGVITAVVDLDDFQQLYAAINLGKSTALYLLREDGTLLLRNPPLPATVSQKFPELATLPRSPVTRIVNPLDGKREFIAVAKVRDTPLLLAVTRDEATALLPWQDEAIRVGVRTLILIVLGMLTIVALMRQLRRVESGERALRESEERYALAMEGANEGHWDWDVVTDRLFLSPKMKMLTGLAEDSVVVTRSEWMARMVVHPDDLAGRDDALRDHFAGRTSRYTCEYRVRQPSGTWRWLLARGRCMRDAAGRPCRFVGSALEITQQKQAQLDKEHLEAQLRQSQKMEAIGTLAGGIAHDFNNILGAILGYGELAQQQSSRGSTLRRYLDNVMHAAERAKTLVDRILGFSRAGLSEPVPANDQSVIEETLELIAGSLSAGVRLEQRLEAADATVIGDAARALAHGHGEAVLIVDDEQALMALAEEMLAELSYEPVGFDSSRTALQVFKAEPQRFDLVLTDEVMPDLLGTEFASEIRRLRPDIPIILMSGYGGPQLATRAAAIGINEVLRKPLQRRDLAESLARVLEFGADP